jgi:hypothetical protein
MFPSVDPVSAATRAAGRDAVPGPEGAGEVGGAAETPAGGDLGDGAASDRQITELVRSTEG